MQQQIDALHKRIDEIVACMDADNSLAGVLDPFDHAPEDGGPKNDSPADTPAETE